MKIEQTCIRCAHQWESLVLVPAQCPKCKSKYWDKQRKNVFGKVRLDKKSIGRQPRYPQLQALEVGQTCMLSWSDTADVFAGDPRPMWAVSYAARGGNEYTVQPTVDGLFVQRIR